MSADFKTVDWVNGSNIYEVNIRQYTKEGTFAAFAKHLPRLKDMGVKILWLMPVTPISIAKRQGALGSYYACSSYIKINEEFGTMDDFKSLVKMAHELDFKLIIDWVANHTGWDHEWTKQHSNWYKKNADGNFTETHGWIDVIDLNYDVTEMKTEMIKSMQFWITECDIDGFRCDMAHLVRLDFWEEARKKCDVIKPMYWLAECEVEKYAEVFDATYAWEWMHVTEKLYKGETSLHDMLSILNKYEHYSKNSQKLFFTSNHDENSWNGTEYEKYGNAAKTFAVFSCTWPGMLLVYSGQELPNLKRLKFFDKDEIEWNQHSPLLHDFYSTLLSLKKINAAFHNGASLIKLTTNADDKVLAYLCVHEKNKALVLLNLSNAPVQNGTINNEQLEGNYRNIFSGRQYLFRSIESFELQAWEYAVYST